MNYKLIIVTVFIFPLVTFGQGEYIPLVEIPGLTGGTSMEAYLNTLYALSISIAALLAVIKIIVAGVKYMLSDVITTKAAAIGDIRGALIGLIIVIMAWLILFVINPNLVSTSVFLASPESNARILNTTISRDTAAILGEGYAASAIVCETNCETERQTCINTYSGIAVDKNANTSNQELYIVCARSRANTDFMRQIQLLESDNKIIVDCDDPPTPGLLRERIAAGANTVCYDDPTGGIVPGA